MYRLGWPFSIFLGSIGIPLLIKIEVICDVEAGVYVATSSDLKGLVVEAETLDAVKIEVMALVPELLSLNIPKLHKRPSTDLSFTQHLSLA
jgi:hypothetical protein